MGETVRVKTKLKLLDVMEDALVEIYGWNRSIIQRVTPQGEREGETLAGHLFGGVQNSLPVVLMIPKKHLTDEEGNKAVFSDFVVCRNPDGTLEIQTDLHNFDARDIKPFVTPEMEAKINSKCAQKACDKHFKQIPGIKAPGWLESGENIQQVIQIPESTIKQGKIPKNAYM